MYFTMIACTHVFLKACNFSYSHIVRNLGSRSAVVSQVLFEVFGLGFDSNSFPMFLLSSNTRRRIQFQKIYQISVSKQLPLLHELKYYMTIMPLKTAQFKTRYTNWKWQQKAIKHLRQYDLCAAQKHQPQLAIILGPKD